MTNYGTMPLAAIMTQYDAYQSLSHGTTANSISRKLSANNKLYNQVEKSLFDLRGDSKKWSDLIELQSISDQLKLDKKTEIDLLEAVRAEADQYVQPDPERSQDYIVLSELLDDGYSDMALHMTHQSARTNQYRTAVSKLANSSHNRLDARHDISTEASRIADQVVQSVTASDTYLPGDKLVDMDGNSCTYLGFGMVQCPDGMTDTFKPGDIPVAFEKVSKQSCPDGMTEEEYQKQKDDDSDNKKQSATDGELQVGDHVRIKDGYNSTGVLENHRTEHAFSGGSTVDEWYFKSDDPSTFTLSGEIFGGWYSSKQLEKISKQSAQALDADEVISMVTDWLSYHPGMAGEPFVHMPGHDPNAVATVFWEGSEWAQDCALELNESSVVDTGWFFEADNQFEVSIYPPAHGYTASKKADTTPLSVGDRVEVVGDTEYFGDGPKLIGRPGTVTNFHSPNSFGDDKFVVKLDDTSGIPDWMFDYDDNNLVFLSYELKRISKTVSRSKVALVEEVDDTPDVGDVF